MSAEAPIMELERKAPEVLDEHFELDEEGLKLVTYIRGHFVSNPELGEPVIGYKGEETRQIRLVATPKEEEPTILRACMHCNPGTQEKPLYKPLPSDIRKRIKGISYGACAAYVNEVLEPVRARRIKKEEERQKLEEVADSLKEGMISIVFPN